jgi:hypothetical protein
MVVVLDFFRRPIEGQCTPGAPEGGDERVTRDAWIAPVSITTFPATGRTQRSYHFRHAASRHTFETENRRLVARKCCATFAKGCNKYDATPTGFA